jgi:K+-sensing histidine kinase KdpD
MNLGGWSSSLIGRYAFAVIAVAVAGGATLLIPTFGSDRPFLLFLFGAVVASGWFGGVGAGWFAVLLATLLIDLFYIPPLYAITGDVADLPWLAAFAICAAVGNLLGSRYRALERELRETQERLHVYEAGRHGDSNP